MNAIITAGTRYIATSADGSTLETDSLDNALGYAVNVNDNATPEGE